MAEEAIACAEQEQPDVVLMDVSLDGELDGIEAAIQIKTRFGIPIIFMTGYSDKELMQRVEEAEPIACFVKPVEMKDLKSAIESVSPA